MGRSFFIMLFLLSSLCSCNSQQNRSVKLAANLVGGPCEGCEAVFEYADNYLTSTDTLPGFDLPGSKIAIEGTVFEADGVTPAGNVILYIYHTNQNGIYPVRQEDTGWARRHGFIRTWLKTDWNGHYKFVTLRPKSYPDRSEPEHIHITVLEPSGKYYWLDSYYFADDPLLESQVASNTSVRGGKSNIITLIQDGNIWTGKRDITLGKNIPDY